MYMWNEKHFTVYPQFKLFNRLYIMFANFDIIVSLIVFMVFVDRYFSIYTVFQAF